MDSTTGTADGPLDGIRVVEMGVWVAGPAAGGILADWGADVVKIEPPSGDPARIFGKLLGGDMDANPPFELDNRSKRSVVLDVTTEDGRATALELIATADVFLTNIRPAALERVGLDPDTLLARRRAPRLRPDHRLRPGGPRCRPGRLRHRRLLGPLGHRRPAHRRRATTRRSSAAAWATTPWP